MITTQRRGRVVALAASLALVGTAVLAGSPAQAQDSHDADTGATLQVDSSNPNGVHIECSWALEDVDSNWDNGMDYRYGNYHGDATPNLRPSPTPCTGGLGEGRPDQPREGGVIHIDVLPNSHDKPTEQYVELWSAVDFMSDPQNPANPLSVDWEIYHPDGTLKFQVPGSLHTDCNGPSDGNNASMFGAAIATGQVEADAVQSGQQFNTDTIQNLCAQGEKHLFYGAFPISKHQPHGTYTVIAKANDNYGSSQQVYFINVMPFHDLQADFDTVNWGSLTRNSHRRVIGDFLMNTGERPTVVNRGNTGISIHTKLTDLCLVGFENQCDTVSSKRIDEFDSAFGVGDGDATPPHFSMVAVGDLQDRPNVLTGDQGNTPIPGGEWMYYDYDGDVQRAQTLCPNDRGKVEFSLYTKANQEPGRYAGMAYVRAVPPYSAAPQPMVESDDGREPHCETDRGSVYAGDFFYNRYVVDYGLVTNGYWT